ncbi:methyl-accepting chemotaxis protein [Seleniivibrio sp.]|uniref:HAMP domain-containing methyl-accepting chemotaxis protein n=1 Tax=Seleniivibrio sp. TaxID=2898801 RepID=UPI0025FD2FE9|nr:methyl-accepting chemotaxis protein [Seleniivibrio sp.]MCD8553716.1 methyl-accepting chemotaxis protein [Seleniivibrio sp.]
MLNNMKLSLKLTIGFGIVLLFLVVMGLVSYFEIKGIASQARKMDTISNVQNAIYEARIARFMYSNSFDESYAAKTDENLNLATKLIEDGYDEYPEMKDDQEIQEILVSVKTYHDKLKEYVATLETKNRIRDEMAAAGAKAIAATNSVPAVHENLLKMRIEVLRYMNNTAMPLDEVNRSFKAVSASASGMPNILSLLNEYEASFKKSVETVEHMASLQNDMLKSASNAQKLSIVVVEKEKAKMNTNTAVSVIIIIVFSLASVALGTLLSVLITRSLTVPMGKAMDFAANLSKGDFSKPLDIRQTDEIGHLAAAMEEMRLRLKEIIENIILSANSLASGSTELASTTEELASTFSEQSQQVSSVASAVEEISTSSALVMQSIHEVSDKSSAAKGLTAEGQKHIESANDVMGDIRKNVSELSTTVAGLAKSSEDIGSILLVINDIADQTNLLALNAAIEAARAGDHGRGFAVVADEVRKLAERTQQSTEEIRTIISQFVKETARTNTEMIAAGKKVETGAEKLNAVDQIFEKIVESVNEISTSSSMITTAVGEQSQAITNINDNAQVISSGLEQSTAAISQVSHTVADLQKQADEQMEGTRIFKI